MKRTAVSRGDTAIFRMRMAMRSRSALCTKQRANDLMAIADQPGALDGKTILVTGASRGLGRAMTLGLLAQGARVALACTGASAPLDETLKRASALAPETNFR